MAAYIILFILSVGLIISSAFTVSSAKKYLRSPAENCFGITRDRFYVSLIFFIFMLAVLAYMLIPDFGSTMFIWLMIAFQLETEFWIVPVLFFGSLTASFILWICSAAWYSKALKAAP